MPDFFPSLTRPRPAPHPLARPLAALGLLLATAGAAHAQAPAATFAAIASYGTGGLAIVSIAVADVNGDGKPDLLTANYNSNTAGVLLGNGNGTFQAATTYSTGTNSNPQSIVVADVNGDGKPDLLTANYGNNSAGVLLGNGNGTFQAVVPFNTGSISSPNAKPSDLAVADVNGDGKLDILTANSISNTAGVLLGNGNGTFQPGTTYSTGGDAPTSIAVADVNGDGKLDIIATNSLSVSSTAGVLLGNGNGTFQPAATYSTGTGPFGTQPVDLAVADVNGDGKPDILTANFSSGNAGVLLGNGNGTFQPVATYGVGGNSVKSIAVADVNGDGKPDILTAIYGNAALSNGVNDNTAGVLLGTGMGSFGTVATFSTGAGSSPQSIAVADVNGDGKPDLLTANSSTNTAGVLLNTTPMPGTRSFLPVATYSTGAGSSPTGIAVADVDTDGKLDLLTANIGSSRAGVQLGTSTGAFGAITTYGTGDAGTRSIVVADVNNDGKPDLLTANSYSNTVGVLLGTSAGSFGTAITSSTGGGSSEPYDLTVADVNGDGKLDLITTQNNSGLRVLLGTGTGSFGTATPYGSGGGSGRASVAVADVNGDGKLDLLTVTRGSNIVGVLLGTGTGSFGIPSTYSTGFSNQSYNIAVADVNNDGKLDVLTVNINSSGGNGTASVLLGTGTGTFGTANTYNTRGLFSNSIIVADVNGDGKPDLLTTNTGSDTVSVLLGTGTGSFGAADIYSTGTSSAPEDIAIADVNGDGKPDILTTNTGTNAVGVLLGTVIVAPTLTSLSPTSGPVGTSVTLTGTNLTGATGVSFGGTAATTFTVVNGTTITATVPAGAASGAVSVTTPGGTATGPTFTVITNLVVTTTTPIQPGTYNSITVNSPGVGTLGGNVTVTTSLTVNNGATLNDGCAIISGVGSFTLAAGGTLGICAAAGISSSGASGAVQVTGTRSFSPDASYVYNGTTTQSTGSGLPAQVRNLSTTNASNVTLTSSTSATQVVTVGNAGNLLLDGTTLTLLSTSAGTALVVNADSGRVRGVAVVQRYIDGSLNSGPGYRHFSVPVIGTTLADFATSSFTPVLNTAFNSSPTPAAVTPFPNLYIYDQSALASRTNNLSAFDKGWLSPGSLNAPTGPGRGYCLNLSAGQVVDVTGTLFSNALTVGLSRTSGATAADGGWALIGNPYPAPLDLSLVQASDRVNLDAATYVVQSTGQYAGGYRAYVNGVSTSASNNPLLAMGQGFFTRVSAGQTTGSFTFRNAQRVTSYASQATFQRPTADSRPQVRLELAGAGLADGWVAYAEAGATPAFDSQLDAGKLPNSTGLNLSSVLSTDNLAIDGQPAFTASTVLPLAVGVPAAGTYTLSATALHNLPAGLNAYLRDSQTGQTLLLSAGSGYSFSVSAAQAATLLTGRFTLLFRPQAPLATVTALAATDVTVYPNPAQGSFTVALPGVAGASTVQAELRNALGQVVRRQAAALPPAGTTLTLPTADLAAGVYVLRLQAGATTLAKRVVVQ